MTLGYARVSWEVMVRKHWSSPVPSPEIILGVDSGKFIFGPKRLKEGEAKILERATHKNMVGAWGFEPQTPTVSILLVPLN